MHKKHKNYRCLGCWVYRTNLLLCKKKILKLGILINMYKFLVPP